MESREDSSDAGEKDAGSPMERAVAALRGASRIMVFTGAGMSAVCNRPVQLLFLARVFIDR